MSDYRRNYVPGGTYFFTVVTYRRRAFLTDPLARTCLHESIADVRAKWPFDIVAIVLLPNHFHTVVTLPRGDANYSIRLKRIKELFTRRYLDAGGMEFAQSASRRDHGERGVWQRRFWEHTVDDEADLKNCVDYVHWNPKKHGLVTRVRDWPWSSFHRYVELGEYDLDWGSADPTPGFDMPEWGD